MKTIYKLIVANFLIFTFILSSCEKDNQTGTVADNEGNVYKTVKIGDQWWMAENLKTTKYNDSQSILNVIENAEWNNLTTAGYCWYNNDDAGYKNPYGALYNWYAVSSGRLCPIGWHVPSKSEWTTLANKLGGEQIAGGKLKETGTTHWQSPNTGATDIYDFTALPGGYRGSLGAFMNILQNGYWWSSTEFNETEAYLQIIDYNASDFGTLNNAKRFGFSVRCVKD
jgi:uncharacterized protein (TIGR02145 family)